VLSRHAEVTATGRDRDRFSSAAGSRPDSGVMPMKIDTDGMGELLGHPDQLQLLRADRSLLPGALEEMLRRVSPIKNMVRTATVDVALHGATVCAGDKVLLKEAANRDERAFADPDHFDIRRSPNDHVAFGFAPTWPGQPPGPSRAASRLARTPSPSGKVGDWCGRHRHGPGLAGGVGAPLRL
jgi:hypothetical protein